MKKQRYSHIVIMDTGLNDCHNGEYRAVVQEDAQWLEAELSYVQGGTYLLEKLFSGDWDEQFLILEKDGMVDGQESISRTKGKSR